MEKKEGAERRLRVAPSAFKRGRDHPGPAICDILARGARRASEARVVGGVGGGAAARAELGLEGGQQARLSSVCFDVFTQRAFQGVVGSSNHLYDILCVPYHIASQRLV